MQFRQSFQAALGGVHRAAKVASDIHTVYMAGRAAYAAGQAILPLLA